MSPGGVLGVVGAGVMGSEIAFLGAMAGDRVYVYDSVDGAAERGRERVQAIVARRVDKGRIDADAGAAAVERVGIARDLSRLARCDVVIEAVPEVMDVKAAVFWDLNRALSGEALVASNTSGLSISELAAITDRPDRVVGMHFFNPASVMPLVEVIAGAQTSAQSLEQATELVARYGKTPVRVRECPGFLVNRILVRAMTSAYRETEATGADPGAVDRAVVDLGPAPMGPHALGDLVGLDTLLGISRRLEHAFGASFAGGDRLPALVSEGALGAKSERGFDARDTPADAVARGPARAYYRAALAEAHTCADEQIATVSDIDLAMRLGAGWEEGPLVWGTTAAAAGLRDRGEPE